MNDMIKMPQLQTMAMAAATTLEKLIIKNNIAIEAWFRSAFNKTPPPFYSSVDLRNSGFKLAPIDTNLFPGGFNNLNTELLPLGIQAVQATIDNICPEANTILLIPENHTRNIFYWENISTLQEILVKAGFTVYIGSLLPQVTVPKDIKLPSGKTIRLIPIIRTGDRLVVDNISPCLILLNNDLATGVPAILQNLAQPIMPSTKLGWDRRLKSTHFRHYQIVAEQFAAHIGLDPWLITPLFSQCEGVNFKERQGEECLIEHVDSLLAAIQNKYHEYGIEHKPFLIIKADAGTYGMAVMTVHSSEDITNLTSKGRSHMSTSKSGKPVDKVILQEGIYTFETIDNAFAEPVVYMIGRHVIGGFYRIHAERKANENLNAPGMDFKPLAFTSACNNPESCASANCFYTYGVIARLALLAAARELAELV